ncbi:MAG: sulfur oxidation c-type cytochrome SoxX [Gammaproteobacteria bacterium]
MSCQKYSLAAGLAALVTLSVIGGGVAAADPSKSGKADYTAMSPEELADYLVFEAQGFRLDQETQEGATVRERLEQDELQRICSALQGASAGADTASKVTAMAREAISYPEGGIKLGDWKKGEEVARSGYGFRVGHKTDDHSSRPPGGNCYACHQLDPAEIAYGTLGPSLTGYGKTRGTGEAMLKYTYDVIYNPHAYFPCTKMPRFGVNGVLTQEQIADVMAYVMHPDSPVNK